MTPLRPCNAIVNSRALPLLSQMEEKSYTKTGDTLIFLEVNISEHVFLEVLSDQGKTLQSALFLHFQSIQFTKAITKEGGFDVVESRDKGTRNRLGRLR